MRVQPSNPKGPGFVRPPWQLFANWWTPVITDCSVANSKAHRTYMDLSVERQAAVDYGEEYSAIAKLAAGFVPDRVTPDASADALPRTPQSKAA
jgi:hypothetical protein